MTTDASDGRPLVSLIIPSFNKEAFLAEAIDSALAQTHPNIEVIVVDDGSTDGSLHLAQTYDTRIRVIPIANSGVSAARNVGIMAAQGQYIALVDADDLLDADCVAARVSILEQDKALGICVGAFRSVDATGSSIGSSGPDRMTPIGDQFRHAVRTNWGVTCGAVIRRRSLDLCGAFDPLIRVCEDWDLLIRISALHQFHYDPVERAAYRVVPGSLSRSLVPLYDSAVQVMRKNSILRRSYWSFVLDSNIGLYNHCMGMIFSRARSNELGGGAGRAILSLATRRPRVALFVAIWSMRAVRNRLLRLIGLGRRRKLIPSLED